MAQKLIDITDPAQWAKFVDKDGYVSYRAKHGTVGFPVKVPANEKGCGWWGEEHFKTDDYHIKMQLGEGESAAHLVSYPDL